jgi:transposase
MAYDFNIAARRAEERSKVEKAETAYNDLTSRWRTRSKEKKAMENPDL